MTVRRQLWAAWTVVSAVTALALIQALLPWPGVAKSPTVEDLEVRVAALEAKLACVTAGGTDFVFEGCNVHVRNGDGATDTTNGLGNLVVGYNEDLPTPRDRSGSHNFVVGPTHSYASYGGLIAGEGNTITDAAPHASISGGAGHLASGRGASVSGGFNNQATALYASVSGGADNVASAEEASVSGGIDNTASGMRASVSGGDHCTASGSNDWVGVSGTCP